jgi:hypothetical protein
MHLFVLVGLCEAAHGAMDSGLRGAEARLAARTGLVLRRGGAARAERGPGGDQDDVRERELRRVTQAEHGEAAVARDEADGERAAVAPVQAIRHDRRPPLVMRI